jgi:hypothetical protein
MARALGTDDSITNCDCCGRSGLKFTVIIELDDGDIAHYGQVCAGRNTGKAPKVIKAEIRDEAKRVIDAAAAEYRACPEFSAYRAALARRPRNLIGRAAMEFVSVEGDADDAARARIAVKYGVAPYALPA